jgi:hypothetical protein
MHPASQQLVFHGAIVLLFGLVLGAPYARAIKRGAPAQIVNSWRVAHLSLPIGATLMFAIATVLPALAVSAHVVWVIALAFIISSYAFCVSTPLAAITGERGLATGVEGWGRLVYLGNRVGAWSTLVAAVTLVYAAFVSLG